MKILVNAKCEICGSRDMLTVHHMFSQTKLNKKLYGDLIHDSRNLMVACSDCHLNKSMPKLTEIEFCLLVGIRPRSKTGKAIWARLSGETEWSEG